MSSGEEKIDKDVWGEYLKLGSPVPIVAIRILEKYSLVSYNWDDWIDFYHSRPIPSEIEKIFINSKPIENLWQLF